jgi:hypothetical protein
MTWGAFHQQGSFVESSGHYSPGSATASSPHGERRTRWMALSRHPGPFAGARPFWSGEPDIPTLLHSTRAPTLSRRRSPRPRPLFTRPCPLFLERVCRAYSRPDVAYRLLQLALRRAGTNPSSRSSLGRGPRPPSGSDESRCFLAEAVTRGEPRYVRSFRSRCRFLPLAQVCPTAISTRTRHLRRLAPTKLSSD